MLSVRSAASVFVLVIVACAGQPPEPIDPSIDEAPRGGTEVEASSETVRSTGIALWRVLELSDGRLVQLGTISTGEVVFRSERRTVDTDQGEVVEVETTQPAYHLVRSAGEQETVVVDSGDPRVLTMHARLRADLSEDEVVADMSSDPVSLTSCPGPSAWFSETKSYIVCGGCGAFGDTKYTEQHYCQWRYSLYNGLCLRRKSCTPWVLIREECLAIWWCPRAH